MSIGAPNGVEPHDTGALDTPDCCPGCHWNLAALSGIARYCPHCGSPLSVPDQQAHSLIVRGYASALFRLGAVYEKSLGAGYHPNEAVRCYSKAAQLGNESAKASLSRMTGEAGDSKG
ncbi:MAG TPA: hypothetical protein VFC78_01115 [Tepidisphaeraceae bacterium]|nr:hypothetical protein [Tepidisphaeraceae bacterium]